MKIVVKLSMVVLFLTGTSVFAAFTSGSTATFDSLAGWNTSGDFQSGQGFAELGKLGTNNSTRMWTSFTVGETGEYTMSFDYRFTGVDNFATGDDLAMAGIGQGSSLQSTVFQADSTTGLTGSLDDAGTWQTVTSEPIKLEAGEQYWVGFELDESYLSRQNQLITFFDIDNVSLTRVIANPAPGAILLGAIGMSFVGWLRHRKAF